MISQPNNKSTTENPVGRFMVAGGAVIELGSTGKILVNQRGPYLDWHPNEWEIVYGRISQFEGLEDGLKREVKEETGIKDLEILTVLSTWHIFRGTVKKAENELIGITFHCRTKQKTIKLSKEHSLYKWVTPEDALKLISVTGIRRDILKYIKLGVDKRIRI